MNTIRSCRRLERPAQNSTSVARIRKPDHDGSHRCLVTKSTKEERMAQPGNHATRNDRDRH